MKTNYLFAACIFVFTLLICAATQPLNAQNPGRSAVVLYSGVEKTLYWGMICPHNGVEYNYALTDWLNFSAGVGFTRRTSFNVTAYPVYQIVQNIEPNIHLLCALSGNNTTRNNLRLGLGLRHIATKVDYSARFVVKDDEILSIEREKYKVVSNAVSLLLQDDFMIHKQLFIGLQWGCNFYIGDNERQPLKIVTVNPSSSTSSITSHPVPIFQGTLRVGYKF